MQWNIEHLVAFIKTGLFLDVPDDLGHIFVAVLFVYTEIGGPFISYLNNVTFDCLQAVVTIFPLKAFLKHILVSIANSLLDLIRGIKYCCRWLL